MLTNSCCFSYSLFLFLCISNLLKQCQVSQSSIKTEKEDFGGRHSQKYSGVTPDTALGITPHGGQKIIIIAGEQNLLNVYKKSALPCSIDLKST